MGFPPLSLGITESILKKKDPVVIFFNHLTFGWFLKIRKSFLKNYEFSSLGHINNDSDAQSFPPTPSSHLPFFQSQNMKDEGSSEK